MGRAQIVRTVILATDLKSPEKESTVHALELVLMPWEWDSCGPGGGAGRGVLPPLRKPCVGPTARLARRACTVQGPLLPAALQPGQSSCQRATCGTLSQGRDHAASSVDPALYSSGRFLNELFPTDRQVKRRSHLSRTVSG